MNTLSTSIFVTKKRYMLEGDILSYKQRGKNKRRKLNQAVNNCRKTLSKPPTLYLSISMISTLRIYWKQMDFSKVGFKHRRNRKRDLSSLAE